MYIWPFDGSLTAHPNSLLFNAFPGYWPFKVFWFFRKVSCPRALSVPLSLLFACVWLDGRDLPAAGLPDAARGPSRLRAPSPLLQPLLQALNAAAAPDCPCPTSRASKCHAAKA